MSHWDDLYSYFRGSLEEAQTRKGGPSNITFTVEEGSELLLLLKQMRTAITPPTIPSCTRCSDTRSAELAPGAFGRCPERCWEIPEPEFKSPLALQAVAPAFALKAIEIKVKKQR